MDRTLVKALRLAICGAAWLMLIADALVRRAGVSLPKAVGGLWFAGIAVLRKAKPEEVYRRFRHAMLEAVLAVAEKYQLPCPELKAARTQPEASA